MRIATMVLLIIPIFVIGGICLQVFLSTRENRLYGLIIPILGFLMSLLMVANLSAYVGMSAGQILGLIASTLLAANIPTIIMLLIYFICRDRRKQRKRNQLDRMNVQDLE